MAAADAELTVNWRAFELRPEPVEMLDQNGEYLTRAWNPLHKAGGHTHCLNPFARLAWMPKEFP